ncbi:aminotransferase class V-fold PLP-dependent enzyme [Hyphococcus flavus]|uniref:Aminotransferase class V-fold PLP-dependent enzyme n=1 Tax=Hyphococcus flavus TaxID=1866326 RepID=A0AAF0CII6_9PROT|nr:aminotransferase class V-fold PLP-dependent enzyme [Hyphococcus flavus]WDI32892.1 aminotransferase class V-fold PLP-dependent enzyme [Hyphococcus flavus]
MRDQFHFPDKHYFLSHSVGAQPISYDNFFRNGFADPWEKEGFHVWEPWFGAIDGFKRGLSAIIGAHPQDICPLSNVSDGASKIMLSLPERRRRRKIVLTEDDFPTMGFALAQGRRLGYEIVFLPGGARLADPDAWAPAFEDDVQLVAVMQVFSNTSVLSPVREIARRAREKGVFCLVDAAQAAGAVPVRLNEWRPDFALGTSLKYLCGGPGAAWMWADRESANQCAPLNVGWFSHKDPFEFDIKHFKYAEGVGRFTGGTPSVAPLAGALAGQNVINEYGVERVYEHNQRLLSRLADALPKGAFLSTIREGMRGSAVLIKVKDYAAAAAHLAQAGIHHDTRLGAVRVSFHLYNDENDVDALVKALEPHL